MARLSLRLLGPVQIMLDGVPLADFATDKVRALLYYLAIESDLPHRRDMLAGLLWPDFPQAKARQNLRQSLSYLRQAIQDQEAAEPLLYTTRDAAWLSTAGNFWCDVAEFARMIQACRDHRHRRLGMCRPCLQRLKEAGELYRGSFLEGFFLRDSEPFEEWALLKREWLQREVVDGLSLLVEYHIRRGEYVLARQYAWRVVDLVPWREESQRQLMYLLALEGQRSTALAQYETCQRVLEDVLGVEPTAETESLYEQIREGKELASLRAPRNLPVASTPFIGREQELAELGELLADPDCRLLTLVGPGGIGKTRLALELATRQVGIFADGVYFVSIAAVDSVDLLVPVIADALQFVFQVRQDPQEQLLNYLRGKELLLVLDNMEHLLDGCSLLAELLRQVPGLVLLVTSRERLSLQEEWIYEVSGLTYPEEAVESHALTDATEGIDSLKSYSAIALFLQRAQQANLHFALSAVHVPHVVRICRLVEGMPLAVELSVAWVGVHSCEEIAGEIEHNLDILSTRLRNVPARHRSVRATFEHSWGLLLEQERQVFEGLSVFRGGFDRTAAKRVASATTATLMSLEQKSLLRVGTAGRYHMHQLLLQYAGEKLEQDLPMEERTRRQHALHYANFLQRRQDALRGENQSVVLEEIRQEIDNVRQAWGWVLAQLEQGRDIAAAVTFLQQSMESLYQFYMVRGWYQEGTDTFGRGVAALESARLLPSGENDCLLGMLLARQGKCCEFTEHTERAVGLYERSLSLLEQCGNRDEMALPFHGLGYIAHMRGEYAEARTWLLRSLDIYRDAGQSWGVANALGNLCLVARREGSFEEARAYGLESLAIRREIGDQRGISSSLNNLGLVYCDLGEYSEAREALLEALEICRRLQHKVGLGNVLSGLCQAHFRLGDVEVAEGYCYECLEIYRDIGDLWGVAIAFNNLGRMAAECGDHARGRSLYLEAVAFYREIGIRSGLTNTLANLGEACYKLGQYDQARRYLQEALGIAQEIGAIPAVLKSLVCLAPLLAREGHRAAGLELLSFAMSQSAIARDVKGFAQDSFAELAAGLSPKAVVEAEARGRARRLDEVLAEVLGGA